MHGKFRGLCTKVVAFELWNNIIHSHLVPVATTPL